MSSWKIGELTLSRVIIIISKISAKIEFSFAAVASATQDVLCCKINNKNVSVLKISTDFIDVSIENLKNAEIFE